MGSTCQGGEEAERFAHPAKAPGWRWVTDKRIGPNVCAVEKPRVDRANDEPGEPQSGPDDKYVGTRNDLRHQGL